MDKEKRKTKKKTFILSIFPILAVFIPLVATAFSVVSAAVITIDENNYYTYTYTKKDEEENVLYELIFKWSFIGNTEEVAIKWSEDNNPSLYDPEDYPEVLEIPKKVTDDADESVDKTEYTVTAIAAGGFKHTQFKEFDIPDSVTVISPEAFAYCQELTEIVIPKNVDEIAPSTFLDCRELTKVYYQDSSGDKTFSNSKITKLGDHAFDSCVKLNTFYCPDTVVFKNVKI